MRLLFFALLSTAAWAQRLQNNDMFFGAGPAWTTTQGTRTVGWSYQTNYGYQIARESAASVLLDFSFLFAYPGDAPSGSNHMNPVTLGLRFRVPVQSRVSFHAVAAGGGGSFRTASHSTTHGAFAFGGGGDVLLSPRFSLRAEVRDIVTGKGLSGATGRHHVLPIFGVALHF